MAEKKTSNEKYMFCAPRAAVKRRRMYGHVTMRLFQRRDELQKEVKGYCGETAPPTHNQSVAWGIDIIHMRDS